MKVFYIRLKTNDFITKEGYQDVLTKYLIDLILKFYGNPEVDNQFIVNDVDNKFFIVSSDTDNEEDECIIFCDDFFFEKIKEVINNLIDYYGLDSIDYELKDITKEVKFGKCDNEFFIDKFKSDNSEFTNVLNLEKYLETYLTSDDLLDKIIEYGINSISIEEMNLLNEYSNL